MFQHAMHMMFSMSRMPMQCGRAVVKRAG